MKSGILKHYHAVVFPVIWDGILIQYDINILASLDAAIFIKPQFWAGGLLKFSSMLNSEDFGKL